MNNYILDQMIKIKNKKENTYIYNLINEFSQIDSIKDIDIFAKAVYKIKKDYNGKMIQVKCFGKESFYYGHLNNLINYAGVKNFEPVRMPAIEHGINFYESQISKDYLESVPSMIFQGPYKKEMVHKINPQKPVFCIGPYIHYAQDYYAQDMFDEVKKEWGKTAVFFPFHTFETNCQERKLNSIIKQFCEKYSKKYDSLVVCLYWLDVDESLIQMFSDYEIKVVCAGARFDYKFLWRLKTIINLADVIVGDDIGSYIGYSIYAGKKVEMIFDIDLLEDRKKMIELDNKRYIENQLSIFNAFSFNDYDRIKDIYEYFWGGIECIKTPEEIQFILEYSNLIFSKSFGFKKFFDISSQRLNLSTSRYYRLIKECLGKSI